MAKNKKIEVPHYELLYIISNQYTEDELKPMVQKVQKMITDNSGIITYSEEWGKKRFAYPISNFNHGYYFLSEFDLPGRNLNKISTTIKMSGDVLRFQIVAKKLRTLKEIKDEKEKHEEIAKKELEEKKAEIKKEELTAPEIKKEEKKKVDLKDLDEKLDRILDTDDLL